MSLDKFAADDLEAWRDQPATVALIRELQKSRAALLEEVAGLAATGSAEARVRVGGGMALAYAEVLRLVATKGVSDE